MRETPVLSPDLLVSILMPCAVSGRRTIRISGCGPALAALSRARAGQRRAYGGVP